MKHHWLTLVLAWNCFAVIATPCLAQLGGGGGGGLEVAQRGVPTTIDLKDATLGQVVDALEKSSISSEENPSPVNILISDKMRELKVGTLKLNDMYPYPALEAISKLTEESFLIEEVSQGRVLILRPSAANVIVKAIRLPWMDRTVTFVPSNSGSPTNEEQEEAQKKRMEFIARRTEELKHTIEITFKLHEDVSGRSLPSPRIETQESLSMVIVIGAPESVNIAAEIINATNPEHVSPAQHTGSQDAMPIGRGGGGGFF